MLCGSAFRAGGTPADTGFDELRELATAAGDKRSLVLGMAGHLTTLTFNAHYRQAAAMASEFATLVESIGDPAMTAGLLYAAAQAKWEAGAATESLQLSQRVIDVAHGDPTLGDFVIGSPLGWALTLKGAAGMSLGSPRWREDLEAGIAMVRSADPNAGPFVQLYKYQAAMQNGALLPTAQDVARAAQSLDIAQRSGNNIAVAYALMNRGTTLIYHDSEDTAAGLEFLATASEMFANQQLTKTLRRMFNIEFARERRRSGDFGGAIDLATTVLTRQFDTGEMVFRGPATAVLVEALLARGSATDIADAEGAIDRLAAVRTLPGFVLHELPLLRLRALLARAHGDQAGYRQFLQCFRAAAQKAGFEGYLAQAEAMS